MRIDHRVCIPCLVCKWPGDGTAVYRASWEAAQGSLREREGERGRGKERGREGEGEREREGERGRGERERERERERGRGRELVAAAVLCCEAFFDTTWAVATVWHIPPTISAGAVPPTCRWVLSDLVEMGAFHRL
jgi:hypothetical protein